MRCLQYYCEYVETSAFTAIENDVDLEDTEKSALRLSFHGNAMSNDPFEFSQTSSDDG